jgi:glycosyltransferase 2 family protein
MKKKLSIIVSFLLSIGLVWFFAKNIDFIELKNTFLGANIYYVALSGVLLFMSHILRAKRWVMLIEPFQKGVHLTTALVAFLSGTLSNFVIPHSGDVLRCKILQKTENCQPVSLFGTVLTERILDSLILGSMGLSVFLINLVSGVSMLDFFAPYFTSINWPILVVGLLILLGIVFYKKIKNILPDYFKNTLNNLKKGILSVNKLESKSEFLIYCVSIWVLYYLSTLLILRALPVVASVGLLPVLAVLVMGSIGWAGPTQGGVGIFHLLVANTLMFFGYTQKMGIESAIFLHAIFTFFDVVFGLVAFAFVFKQSFDLSTVQ